MFNLFKILFVSFSENEGAMGISMDLDPNGNQLIVSIFL